jgi:hypothetical protein
LIGKLTAVCSLSTAKYFLALGIFEDHISRGTFLFIVVDNCMQLALSSNRFGLYVTLETCESILVTMLLSCWFKYLIAMIRTLDVELNINMERRQAESTGEQIWLRVQRPSKIKGQSLEICLESNCDVGMVFTAPATTHRFSLDRNAGMGTSRLLGPTSCC